MKYSSFSRFVAVLVSYVCLTPALAVPGKGNPSGAYTVKSGDTFAKIARANGVSLAALLAANRIPNPNRILLGQRIIIPGSGTAPATESRGNPLPPANPGRPGKQIPVTTTRKWGGRDDTTVNLAPPALESAHYVVQSGDSLRRIQRRTGVPVSSLLKLNGLTETSVIYPGQKLRVTAATQGTQAVAQQRPVHPKNRVADTPVIIDNTRETQIGPPTAPTATSPPAVSTGMAPHKVESGETFSSISRLYGVTSTQLAGANRGIKPDRIRIGQTLIVPGQPLKPQPKPLIVRADGRILAQRPDPLAIGGDSEDALPAGRTRTGYLVEEGETIQQIAQRFHTTEGVVRRLNRMSDSDNVYAGRYILVPFIRQAPQQARYANRDA